MYVHMYVLFSLFNFKIIKLPYSYVCKQAIGKRKSYSKKLLILPPINNIIDMDQNGQSQYQI